MKSKTVLIELRLQKSTVQMVEELLQETGEKNQAVIVSKSVRLAHWLVQKKNEGATLVIENPGGEKEIIDLV